jgi:16S rRNA (cytidine1402-2'-O)-methyltransferase
VTQRSGQGSLVLVATPIGNLADLSKRALDVLGSADLICCEDTRRTRTLLSASGLPSNPRRLVSLHGHNEASRVGDVLAWLAEGKTVAVVSDAGTPAISDPGQRLVAAVAEAGFDVTAVPGPSSVVVALSLSGLDSDRFCFEGFLPRKGSDRRRRLAVLANEERTAIVLEAPGRLAQTLRDLAEVCGPRPLVVCRELTKLHEEIWRGTLPDAVGAFADRALLGEVVVVLGGAEPPAGPDEEAITAAVGARLEAGDTPRQAADAVAAALGVARRVAYSRAVTLRDGPG